MDSTQAAIVESCAALLQADATPLFVLLDAARDPQVLETAKELSLATHCLYAGFDPELVDFAPYLVALSAAQVAPLVARMWGNSWGVFVRSNSDVETLRRHLRKFLKVKLEGGRETYFRYYDPRVLRIFLPTCTVEQWQEFLGPIDTFIAEDDDASVLLSFKASRPGVVAAHRLDSVA